MKTKRDRTEADRVAAVVRAEAIIEASFVLSYEHMSPTLAARRPAALARLSADDRAWVQGVVAGKIRTRGGSWAEIVERRCGVKLPRTPPPEPLLPDNTVVDLLNRRRTKPDKPTPPTPG